MPEAGVFARMRRWDWSPKRGRSVTELEPTEADRVLVVDAANVVGSRPTGWWRDRPGAARSFVEGVRTGVAQGRLRGPVVVVLEGTARQGASCGTAEGVTVVHAEAGGDDALVAVVAEAAAASVAGRVVLVTADRGLRRRAEALGAEVVGPRWLLGRLA